MECLLAIWGILILFTLVVGSFVIFLAALKIAQAFLNWLFGAKKC